MARCRVSQIGHTDYFIKPSEAARLLEIGVASLISDRHIQMNAPPPIETESGQNITSAHHYKGYSGGMAMMKMKLSRNRVIV